MRNQRTCSWRAAALLACLMLLAAPAAAEDTTQGSSGSSGLGYRGWGPRVGLASGPDQVIAGVHFAVGEFARNVSFQPDVLVGFGDDTTSLVGSAPAWYRFRTGGNVHPYAGGAVAVGLFRRDDDDNGNDDEHTDVEIGLQIGGGAEWDLRSGNRFLVELRLDLIDVWDAYVVAGWTF